MAVQAQMETLIRWIDAGWKAVEFPELPFDQMQIGGGPVLLVNASKDIIFVDLDGQSYEIEPFRKEFVKVSVRSADAETQPNNQLTFGF